MKKKMEQIRNGNFVYGIPRLILSREEIQVQIKPGEKSRGELYFGAENEEKIMGYVNTSSRRFVPSVEKFSGTAIHLAYGIDGQGMNAGDISRGVLTLVTSVGEYKIPFSIEAVGEEVTASIGPVMDMDAFVALAKNNYREAFRLFTSPNFINLIEQGDRRLVGLYRGMSQNPVTYQHLEEFLISAVQKEAVHISLKEGSARYYDVTESIQEAVTIAKSGWGHLRLEVEVEGDFIQVQKKTISEDEFIGSSYQLEYVILRQKLGRGKKHGSILIQSPYETLEFSVTASRNSNLAVSMTAFEKKHKVRLYQDYMKLRLHRLDFKTWSDNALGILQEMEEAGCDYPIYQIYEAYVLHANEQDDKAREILLKYQDRAFTREDIELAGFYLYVCYLTGLLKDESAMVSKLLRLYQQSGGSSMLLFILLQVDEELKGSDARALHLMEEQYQRGNRSPMMYLEAFRLVEKNIELFTRMNDFWIQVMLFGGKEQLLTEELSMRIAYLSGYEKRFNQSLYRILSMAYTSFPQDDTLEAICKMIMKDNPGNKKYFPWFERAVEHNLRLTRLYECYIETIDDRYQKILPKNIRMYFVYNNALGDKKKAFVYANVIRHKDEDPGVYENYRKLIHDFAFRKLQKGVINEDYAVLYQELSNHMENREEEALSRVVFSHRLYCEDPKVRSVIVRHAQMLREESYPCIKGVAYPQIYTEDAVILFQDSQQRRYGATVDYNLRRLFDEEAAQKCETLSLPQDGFLLYQCSRQDAYGKITPKTLEFYNRIADSDSFSREYRTEVRRQLLSYYSANLRGEEIDEYLCGLNYREFAQVDKKQLMELLIERGMLREAYEVLGEFGSENVDIQALLKLCSRMILKYEFEEDEELLSLACEVFQKGIYDEVILHYLMTHYVGAVSAVIQLWERARGFQMDTYRLEERLLTQLIFVEDYRPEGTKVLENYIRQKGREEVIVSYLTFLSYGYFVRHKSIKPYIVSCLEAAYEREWKLDTICRAALLKAYSEKREWEQSQEQKVRRLLEEFGRSHIFFGFFRKFPRELLSAYQLDDKIFVEYQGNPKARVVVYYALDRGLGSEAEYKSEPIRSIYQGYFNKTFTLFYGETLHYYFVTELDGKEERTPERTITATAAEGDSQTRYQMINQMLAARKLGQTQVLKEKIYQYQQQERFVEHLFSIEKEQKHE